jgi:hypothetical protein
MAMSKSVGSGWAVRRVDFLANERQLDDLRLVVVGSVQYWGNDRGGITSVQDLV